jgi:YVTN family beta-propeller protein
MLLGMGFPSHRFMRVFAVVAIAGALLAMAGIASWAGRRLQGSTVPEAAAAARPAPSAIVPAPSSAGSAQRREGSGVGGGDRDQRGPASRHGEKARRSSGPRTGVYASITEPRLDRRVRHIPTRVYVPNNHSNTVDVIDPRTYRVVRSFTVGQSPQHVTPSWNMRFLYVGDTYANELTVIDPRRGRPIRTISIPDPYNLYFTPDGSRAIDVAERLGTLFFYDPSSWKLQGSVHIPWSGPDHLDFSASGRYLFISTEFSGRVVRVDTKRMRVRGSVDVGGLPVDVKLSPDGDAFYVANQGRGGVSVIDARRLREIDFIHTGAGAHGLCVSRDARSLYVSNRLAGTISVVSFATNKIVRTWNVGGSPDMLQTSADGRELWVSNRFDGTVTVVRTSIGRVTHTIPVGSSPHGLTLFPQPGRFSLGHNGVYR